MSKPLIAFCEDHCAARARHYLHICGKDACVVCKLIQAEAELAEARRKADDGEVR